MGTHRSRAVGLRWQMPRPLAHEHEANSPAGSSKEGSRVTWSKERVDNSAFFPIYIPIPIFLIFPNFSAFFPRPGQPNLRLTWSANADQALVTSGCTGILLLSDFKRSAS